MNQDEILAMFRQQADMMDKERSGRNDLILKLAQLLADSRGTLSKENFETLLHIGAVLYKEGRSQFQARSDVNAIMSRSVENEKRG
jgi:hypothetical protein